MKLVHPDIDKHFDFNKNRFYSLVVENSNEFYNLTNDFYIQCNNESGGKWILSKDNTILDISKSILFIYDYFNFDYNSKKIQSLITHEIESIAQANDLYFNIAEINTLISSLNDTICNLSSVPLNTHYDFTLTDLIKLSSYKISTENNFIDSLHSYIDIFQKLKNISLVVFVNLTSYLSDAEIMSLQKQLEYMEINALFIESNNKYTLPLTETVIIDNDLCII